MTQAEQPIDLGEQLDITVVAALKASLEEAVAAAQPVALNGERLQRVDGAGIQLLLAFARAAEAAGGWRWHGEREPEAIRDAAEQLGVASELVA